MKKIDALAPFLNFKDMDGKENKVFFEKNKIIIGRLRELNDISLLPDPQQLVSRYMHCSIEIRNATAWLMDNSSKNGTYLKRKNVIQKIKGEIKLQNDDIILILKSLESTGQPLYWEFLYKDPLATENAKYQSKELVYDWVQAKLFLYNGNDKKELGPLTPLEHKLIRYLDQRNKSNENVPVMCTYEELIGAILEDKYSHTANDINHIVAALRKKIEADYQNPIFLVNIRGMGYRLNTNFD